MAKIETWKSPLFSKADPASDLVAPQDSVLIILNQPFTCDLLQHLWFLTGWRCCADGGANRLYDIFYGPRSSEGVVNRASFLPNMIKGDLDSIRPDVRKYYEDHNVPVIHDPDQNSTDLIKCVSSIKDIEKDQNRRQFDIVILGGLSGRLDQTVHTLSFLHKLRLERRRTFAVTDESVAWVLDEGQHKIYVEREIVGPTCGLLPVGIESTILTTTGLRWNLDNQESSFSGLVSTSNAIDNDVIFIETSRPIWWCLENKAPR